ncbi:hypothetical protein HKD37_02G004965 [Glycine soja]
MTETSMYAGNASLSGFLEPQCIQQSRQSQFESKDYIKKQMHNSQRDVYLGAYLYGAHWQMVVVCPKDNVVISFCSLQNRPDNYLKGNLNKFVVFCNTFTLSLVFDINILIVQYICMFLLIIALKGFNDSQGSKSKVATRWILVKVSYLDNV